MEHRDVGIGALLPPDENSTESVHPTVGALDHPAMRPVVCGLLDQSRLFAAAPDVCREAELLHQIPDLAIVVALVETQPLGREARRLGTGDDDAVEGLARQLEVVTVRACDDDGERNSVGLR
jgi:hypothetical protein